MVDDAAEAVLVGSVLAGVVDSSSSSESSSESSSSQATSSSAEAAVKCQLGEVFGRHRMIVLTLEKISSSSLSRLNAMAKEVVTLPKVGIGDLVRNLLLHGSPQIRIFL